DHKTTHDEKIVREANIQLSSYAGEIGFSLTSPTKETFESHTIVDISGNVEQVDDLTAKHIWVVMTSEKSVESIDDRNFNYYIPIENGSFSKQMNLHNGAGEYEMTVRVPSNQLGEEGMYYDVATFRVVNQDEDIQREVEYTSYGVDNRIHI